MKRRGLPLVLVAFGLFLLLLVISIGQVLSEAPPLSGPTDLAEALRHETQGYVHISYHSGTGQVRFIGTDPDHPIPRPGKLAADATAEEAAREFLTSYGSLFGLRDQAQELGLLRESPAERGRTFLRFQQVHQGIPVLGGELIVQLDNSKKVLSANGEVLPEPRVSITPAIDAQAALERALGAVAKYYGLSKEALSATEPELWVYSPLLLGAPGPEFSALVWRLEVEPKELLPIRELVLVDAQMGAIALHFNQIDTARNRKVYDNQNNSSYGLPGNGPVRVEGGPATGIPDADNAYDYGGDTYNFYLSYHGRDSINGAGMILTSTVRYCPPPGEGDCPYPNAFWNGRQMVYGQGFANADDVVGHEMTHGVTQYESHLFYYMQSGAINESFSDIWGELVDLTNGRGTDTAGVRWLMGEDLSGGASRSMSNPPAYGDPDKMTSSNYYCGEQDNGGVHWNSGVANKAAYLMVDGASFNGKVVTGLGITKTIKIFYEVQTNLFTSASDYQDLYDGLRQACTNLIGTAGITSGDCQQVKNAVDATEMNLQPTNCPATHAPLCPAGQVPLNLLSDNMENPGAGKWTSAATIGLNAWFYPQNSHPFTGFDATYATSGVYNIWGYAYDSRADFYIRMTSGVALPAGSTPYLHFKHAYAFEDSDPAGTWKYDGGVLEYSTDGGSTWNDAGALFTHNGYGGTIYNAADGDNPLKGRQAFVSESNGYISSRLNLLSLAGQNVRFRFRIGTDSSVDAYGWFVDDVRIYVCTTQHIFVPLALKKS